MVDITIICENKVGTLSHITEEFKRRDINLADVFAHVLGEKSIVSISVEDAVLNDSLDVVISLGYTPLVEQSFIIRLPDRVGELSKVAQILEDATINIEALRFFDRKGDEVFVALTTNNPAKTKQVLKNFSAQKRD